METKQKVASETRPASINVSENENGIITSIECECEVHVGKKEEGDKYFKYYIPAFNIHFFAKNEEDGKIIGKAAIHGFFNYWAKNQGKKAFLEEIIRLGFVERQKPVKTITRKKRFSINRPNIPSAYKQKAFDMKTAKMAA